MDFASTSETAEQLVWTRWKGIVVKSSVVPQLPCKIMEYRNNFKYWDR